MRVEDNQAAIDLAALFESCKMLGLEELIADPSSSRAKVYKVLIGFSGIVLPDVRKSTRKQVVELAVRAAFRMYAEKGVELHAELDAVREQYGNVSDREAAKIFLTCPAVEEKMRGNIKKVLG